MPEEGSVTPGPLCLVYRVKKQVQLGSPNAQRGHRNAGTAVRKRTVNTHPALSQQAHPQLPKPATLLSPSSLVLTQPLAVICPFWLVKRPMRRPIAFRPTCTLIFCCIGMYQHLYTPSTWVLVALRPCPVVCHTILKGDRALPSGVGPADRGQTRAGDAGGTVLSKEEKQQAGHAGAVLASKEDNQRAGQVWGHAGLSKNKQRARQAGAGASSCFRLCT